VAGRPVNENKTFGLGVFHFFDFCRLLQFMGFMGIFTC
jgi:hypothetical protein